MVDKPLTAQQFEDIMRRAGMLGGGGGMRRSRAGGGNEGDALNEALEDTEASLRNFLKVQEEYKKRHQAGSFVAGLFGKNTEMAQRNMGQLRNAISQHERMLEELTEQGHTATSTEYKKVQSGLKMLQVQEQMYAAQATGADIVRNSAAQIGHAFLKLYSIQAEYQANLLNIVSQGGSGFQMAAAQMEAAVNSMHAMQSTMAQIAQSAGQSLGQLGGKFAPLAGMALGALGHAAQAAADAQRLLAQTQIRIMAQEGDKLIKTHHELTNAGVIYHNGMKGLINATAGTKLRLEEMSAVIAKSRDSFAEVGIGMSRATDLIGGVIKRFASTTGQFAKMDKQLLALGFSYQEQASLAAETAAQQALGGRQVNEKEVAAATVEMAKSMRLVAEAAGEDMAEKRKRIQEEQREFFIRGQMAKMQRDDPKKYAQFQLQLQGMTEQQRKAAYQMQFYGTVVDKNLAIQMATNSGYKKIVMENHKNLQSGSASTRQALETRKKYGQEEMDGYITLSGTIGKASNALGAFTEVSKNMADSMVTTQKILGSDIPTALAAVEKQMTEAAKPTDKKDPTALLLEAVEKGAEAAKRLQETVIDKLPMLSRAMQKAFDDAIAALEGRGGAGAGGILAKILEYLPILTTALTALVLANQLMPGKMAGIFAKLKPTPAGMPGQDKPSMFQRMKEKFFPEKPQPTGIDRDIARMEAGSKAAAAERRSSMGLFKGSMDKLGTVGSMLAKGAKFLGPVAALGAAAYSGFQGYQNTAANFDLKEGEEATTGQKVSSTLAGITSGLTFGLLDEKMLAQGFQNINLKVQESWGQMATSLGAWTAGLSKSISSAWSASSNYISGKWRDVSSWAKKSTDEFLAAHPKLAEAIAKFPKSFDEAGRLAKNLIGDTQAKFKAEFPKLYANLESTFKTVGTFTSGLMDSISNKWKDARGWLSEKLGFSDKTQPATANVANPAAAKPPGATPAKPADASGFNDADRKNIQSWADGVNAGKYGLDNVPAVYRAEVAKLVKSKSAKPGEAKPGPKATDARPVQGTPADKPGSTPPPRVTLGSMPAKQALTAAEKANVMETVAGNTKYTNDLLIASQKNLENLNKIMIQKLESIVSATEASAGYGKKTARNTS